MKQTKQYLLNLTPAEHDLIKTRAKKTGRTIKGYILMAVRYMAEHGEGRDDRQI